MSATMSGHATAERGDRPRAARPFRPLFHPAVWARRSYAVCGWLALAFGVSALARYAATVDRVLVELPDDVPARLTAVTERLGGATLVALVLSGLLTASWGFRGHRNLPALDLAGARWTPWSFAAWLAPGRSAREGKRIVDATWRDTSPTMANLPGGGGAWSRRPVSRVVLRWWALWLWVPAVGVMGAVVAGPGLDDAAVGPELALAGVAAAAALVATLRAVYDVVGIITAAQAHRAESILRGSAAVRWIEASILDDVRATSSAAPAG